MQELPRNPVREPSRDGPGSEIGTVESFLRTEKSYFSSAPVARCEERLTLLQQAITTLAELTRDRRKGLEAERCAVCGDRWKIRLPDGGLVPVGGEDMIDPRTRLTMRYLACSESCLGKLKHDIEHRTFKALKDYDEEQAVRHLRPTPPPIDKVRRARR